MLSRSPYRTVIVSCIVNIGSFLIISLFLTQSLQPTILTFKRAACDLLNSMDETRLDFLLEPLLFSLLILVRSEEIYSTGYK